MLENRIKMNEIWLLAAVSMPEPQNSECCCGYYDSEWRWVSVLIYTQDAISLVWNTQTRIGSMSRFPLLRQHISLITTDNVLISMKTLLFVVETYVQMFPCVFIQQRRWMTTDVHDMFSACKSVCSSFPRWNNQTYTRNEFRKSLAPMFKHLKANYCKISPEDTQLCVSMDPKMRFKTACGRAIRMEANS